jgi:hypothetical protein
VIFMQSILVHSSMAYAPGSKVTFSTKEDTHSILKPKSPVAGAKTQGGEKQTIFGGYKITTFSSTWVTGLRPADRALAFRSTQSEIRSDFVNLREREGAYPPFRRFPPATTKVSKQEKTWEGGPASTHASSGQLTGLEFSPTSQTNTRMRKTG